MMAATRWGAIPPSNYVVEQFEEVYFCYARFSGQTHVLTEFPFEILQQLHNNALTDSELSAIMADLCDTPCDAPWLLKVQQVLSHLHSIGLLSSCQP